MNGQGSIWQHLAWLLPDKLAYWAAVRVIHYGTSGKYTDPCNGASLTVLDRFRQDKHVY